MKYIFPLILISALLSGCSTLGFSLPDLSKPSYDESNVIASIKPLDPYTAPAPADLPAYPKVKVIEGTSKVYACFEEEGFREIVRLRGYHETNVQEISDLQAVIDARTNVANEWLKTAQASEKEANGLKKMIAVNESDAKNEKRELTKTLWRDRIIGGSVIVLLIMAL